MTHKNRTGKTEVIHYPGKSFDPPRFSSKSKREIFEEKPRTETIWKSEHTQCYSLLIADEAQKVKNPDTDTWCVLRVHQFPKTILATATPMFNAAQVCFSTLLFKHREGHIHKNLLLIMFKFANCSVAGSRWPCWSSMASCPRRSVRSGRR